MLPETQASRLRGLGEAIGIAIVAFIVGNIVVLVTAGTLEAFGVPVFSRPARSVFLGTVLVQGIAFGGVAYVYLRIRGFGLDFIRVGVPNIQDLKVAIGGILVLLLFNSGASLLLSHLGIESAQNQIVKLGHANPLVFLLLIPLSFLLVGPGEELLFRGLIQGRLEEPFPTWRAILLASGLFALVHIWSLTGEGKLAYVGIVFGLALVLGTTYEYTDNLAVPALIHGTYNAVLFGGSYLATTGLL